jgi:hypothetical protein
MHAHLYMQYEKNATSAILMFNFTNFGCIEHTTYGKIKVNIYIYKCL